MFKKHKYKDLMSEVSKVCETCKFASPLHTSDSLFCSKKGPVSPNYVCKKYDFNQLIKRPPKMRKLNIALTPEELKID